MKIDLHDLPKDSIEKASTLRDLNLEKFFFIFSLLFSHLIYFIHFSKFGLSPSEIKDFVSKNEQNWRVPEQGSKTWEDYCKYFFFQLSFLLSIHFFHDQIIFTYRSLAIIRVTTALRNMHVYVEEENNIKICYSLL